MSAPAVVLAMVNRTRATLAALPIVVAVLAISGCVVVAQAPPARFLSPQEAVDIATRFARSRGLVIDQTIDAYVDVQGFWHVDLAGANGRDRAEVILDGYSGEVLHARLQGGSGAPVAPPPAPAPDGLPPGP